jgi:hypothetical protein
MKTLEQFFKDYPPVGKTFDLVVLGNDPVTIEVRASDTWWPRYVVKGNVLTPIDEE